MIFCKGTIQLHGNSTINSDGDSGNIALYSVSMILPEFMLNQVVLLGIYGKF